MDMGHVNSELNVGEVHLLRRMEYLLQVGEKVTLNDDKIIES